MKRSALAAGLLRAKNNSERKKLLAKRPVVDDARLARELKDYCYEVWTSEPAKTRDASAAIRYLSEFSRDRETAAIANWVYGIADITNGKLESAVKNLEAASRSLEKLGAEHESAQPLVAKLIALAMLGRYRAAQTSGENALRIFDKYRDQLAAGKIEMNLSNIVSRRDQYKLAEKYCLSAHRRFKKLGELSWQTMAENGLANTYAELNDFKKAEDFYGRALANARRLKMHVTVAEIEASMGNLALFRGRFAEAIRMLELSRQKYEKLGMPHQTAIADLEIADIYGEMNLTSEAVELYRRVIPTLHRLKMRADEGRARANFGRTLVSLENFSGARSELKRAAALFERERNPTALAAVQIRLSSLELSRGKYSEALEIAKGAASTLEQTENQRLKVSAEWLTGHTLAKLGRYKESERSLTTALKKSRKLEQPAVAQAAMNSLGIVARETGDTALAERMFESAIDTAESARAPLPGEEFRMAFLAKSLEPYENLTQLYLAEGRLEDAFVAVERARSRTLLDTVESSKPAQSDGQSNRLREELNWLYSRLSRADADESARLQKQVIERERKLASQVLRAQSSSADSSARAQARLDLKALQARLGEGRALIEFVRYEQTYSVFVVTNKRIEYVSAVALETDIMSFLEGLHFQFSALRFGTAAVSVFAAQLKSRADIYLRKLYDSLLSPIVNVIGDRDLIIVPSGVLNYVPFHALFDGERYVLEDHEVAYSPSAAVWTRLSSEKMKPAKNALLMGFADESIPLVNHEVAMLGKIVRQPTKLTGKRATFDAFRENAPKYDLIHLACHGQFRPDNPMFSSLHLADGWVTVRDVCATRLDAQLVTLSACETGLNKILAGDEILGLARGFISAGARSLLLSLWTVNDEATTRLMEQFYSNLQRGPGISASLRIAQKDFVSRGEHPYYWSPFFVIG